MTRSLSSRGNALRSLASRGPSPREGMRCGHVGTRQDVCLGEKKGVSLPLYASHTTCLATTCSLSLSVALAFSSSRSLSLSLSLSLSRSLSLSPGGVPGTRWADTRICWWRMLSRRTPRTACLCGCPRPFHALVSMRIGGWGLVIGNQWIRVQGSGFRVQGSGFRVQGSGLVHSSGLRVQGAGVGIRWGAHVLSRPDRVADWG